MKYLAVAITLAACFELGRGLSCYVCEEEGHAVICSDNGDNEIEKECGDHIIGCVEEVVLVKNTSESRTMRFCMDPSNPHASAASYLAPAVADKLGLAADETAAKGCMRTNTEKYQIGVFVCDKQLCNKDLDQGDCAHVCEDKAATAQHQDDHRSPRLAAKPKDPYQASKCWCCTREENGTTIDTLCDEDNMRVCDCAEGVVGCVELKMAFGPPDQQFKHDLRHCLVPDSDAARALSPRGRIPVPAFDDEVYAKGCLKYYNSNSTVDLCICDTDECNKDCDCEYECENTDNTPAPETTTPGGGGGGAVAAVPALTALFAVVAKILI